MYQLIPSTLYKEELERLSVGTEGLLLLLEKGVYHILRNNPEQGRLIPDTDMRWLRSQVIRGILLVEIYYRIDEEKKEVRLASIRDIDMTVL